MSKKEILPILIIVIMFVIGFVLYPNMPDKVPIHWDSKGEIDGYGSKFVGLLLMPMVVLGIYLLFLFIPKIMVYKKNFKGFERYYHGFKLMMVAFLGSLYLVTLLPSLGIEFNMTYFMIVVLAVLFYYIGHIMQYFKRNFFIGIRTPWTLSSDKVWEKTHKLGSMLFRASAVIMLLCLFKYEWFIWVMLVTILGSVIWVFVYSYFEFQKVGGKNVRKKKKVKK